MSDDLTYEADSLGWGLARLPGREIEKKLSESPLHSIVRLRSGKNVFLPALPALSQEEERLIASILLGFQREAGQDSNVSVFSFCRAFCARHLIRLVDEQKKAVVDTVEKHAFGSGPLTPLLEDPSLEEISVSGSGIGCPVRVFHRKWGWLDTSLFFRSDADIVHWANRLARVHDRALSLQEPRINAVLSNGDRLHAAIPPIAFDGPSLTVRRFSTEPFSWSQLVQSRTLSLDALSFLARVMRIDANVLVCGNTGSGKTTTLNALLQFFPPDERLVVIEETPEVQPLHKHVVRLSAQREVGLSELVLDSLRMRPDRLIVGEIRSKKEVSAFVDTVLAGQGRGSIATFHAKGAHEAFQRLMRLGVDEKDLSAIDLVIVQKRFTRIDPVSMAGRECRRITEICEVRDLGAGVEPEPVFSFDFSTDELVAVSPSEQLLPRFWQSLEKNLLEDKPRAWEQEEHRLRELLGKNLRARDFFEAWHAHVVDAGLPFSAKKDVQTSAGVFE